MIWGLFILCTFLFVKPQDQNLVGQRRVDAGKLNIHRLCSRVQVKGRLLMASVRGLSNRGWGYTKESVY